MEAEAGRVADFSVVVHNSLLVILDRLREACASGTATSSDFQHATSSLLQLYKSELSEVCHATSSMRSSLELRSLCSNLSKTVFP